MSGGSDGSERTQLASRKVTTARTRRRSSCVSCNSKFVIMLRSQQRSERIALAGSHEFPHRSGIHH